jgi:hypothetical protein
MDVGTRRGCFLDRRFIEGGIALLSLMVVGLVAAALLGGWRRTDAGLYADPFGCRTRLCARMTTSQRERLLVRDAVAMIGASAWAASPRGRPVMRAVAQLQRERAINVWSLRQLQHSRYDPKLGIMINRQYDRLDPELVAVMIVHEATHHLFATSTYRHELSAYENMLAFYAELRQATGWDHQELAYLADVEQTGGIANQLPCEAIFRGDCRAVR